MIKKSVKKVFSLIDKRSAAFFIFVGTLSAVVYFSSFTLLWKYLDINYKVAVSISYVLSVIIHFCANRRLTFRSHNHRLSGQLVKYIIMISINYVVTLLVMHYVVSVLGYSPYLGVVCAIGSTVGVSYLMAKFWVFRIPVSV